MMDEPLSPCQRAKIRRLAQPVEPEAGEGGELNVVPYLDILMNVMMFVLASVSVAFASTIDASAAQIGPKIVPRHEGLRLTAMITSHGVALKTAGGSIAEGCGDLGPGITVPNARGGYDLPSLTACARRIKGMQPEETQVTVAASPDVSYDTVVQVMDALRADESGRLFPDVTLGAVR
jgi:biopolymer transport protein TolR